MRALVLALAFSAASLSAKTNFIRDVKPILENRCVRCHGPDAAMRGLRLDKKERAMFAIVPRKPEDSRLYTAAKSGFMPPGAAKLAPAEIETLRRWIAEGAHWPKGVVLTPKNPFLSPIR